MATCFFFVFSLTEEEEEVVELGTSVVLVFLSLIL